MEKNATTKIIVIAESYSGSQFIADINKAKNMTAAIYPITSNLISVIWSFDLHNGHLNLPNQVIK